MKNNFLKELKNEFFQFNFSKIVSVTLQHKLTNLLKSILNDLKLPVKSRRYFAEDKRKFASSSGSEHFIIFCHFVISRPIPKEKSCKQDEANDETEERESFS